MATLKRAPAAFVRLSFVLIFVLDWAEPGPAQGAHGGHGHEGYLPPTEGFQHPSAGFHSSPSAGFVGAGVSNGFVYNPEIFLGYGSGGFFAFSPTLTVVGPGGLAPQIAQAFPFGGGGFGGGGFGGGGFGGGGFGGGGFGGGGGGLNLPMPPAGMLNAAQPAAARRPNLARAKELTEIGDRSFRGRNIKRAEEKYNLALKADPTSPVPHVHLAQVALARGRYLAAADHLRDAVTVAGDGNWLLNTPDIQAIFGEPADFARLVAKLETHLQANPNDRNAWFVLGAETYLSGRSRQAFDVFQRLTDRRSDEALAAFLDASKPRAPVDAN